MFLLDTLFILDSFLEAFMTNETLLNYDEMLKSLTGTKHLLLGNGFSINCDTTYRYSNLFQYAQAHGFSDRLNELFRHFGTTNFERVVRALDDTEWLAKLYRLLHDEGEKALRDDAQTIKEALVTAVAHTHLDRPSDIADPRIEQCVEFLKPFDNVFTTNYDLLLYWTQMHGLVEQFEDGFRESVDEPGADYVVFSQHLGAKRGIFYLHGALHLYEAGGEVRKHSWSRSQVPLKEMVLEALGKDQFPMFVAEGEGWRKLEQIQSSSYMSYCLGKLKRCKNNLIVYGSSLGDSDEHIVNAIADGAFQTVCLGVYGDHESAAAKAAEVTALKLQSRRRMQRRPAPLNVLFYDLRTASVWDPVYPAVIPVFNATAAIPLTRTA